MSHRYLARLGLALMLVSGGTARADIDSSAYEPPAAVRPQHERERVRQQIENEAQQQAARERIDAEAQARRLAGERAALEARPYPVKLLEQRCTGCHPADSFSGIRHTPLGWHLVVLRMDWLDGANLDAGDRPVLVAHLSEIQGLAGRDALFELVPISLVLLLALFASWRALGAWREHASGGEP